MLPIKQNLIAKNQYLCYLPWASLFDTQRTRELFQHNPTILPFGKKQMK